MTNLEMLIAGIRVAGLYLLVTTITGIFPLIQVLTTQPEALPVGWVWLYLAPMVLKLFLVLAMVLVPSKLAHWGSSNASSPTNQTRQPDIALIGVRLLGIYFILHAVPGLTAIPPAWPSLTTGQSSLLQFLFQNLAPSLVFLLAGIWMFIGAVRLARFIKSARTANFERKEID